MNKIKSILQKYPLSFLETMCLLGAGGSASLAFTFASTGNTAASVGWGNCFIWSMTAFIVSTNK